MNEYFRTIRVFVDWSDTKSFIEIISGVYIADFIDSEIYLSIKTLALLLGTITRVLLSSSGFSFNNSSAICFKKGVILGDNNLN